MEPLSDFFIGFSDIRIQFLLPDSITLPDNFLALHHPRTDCPDARYQVQLLTQPLRPSTAPVHVQGDTQIFKTDKGWLHIYPTLGDRDGCQVACLFCLDHHHILYYPASRWAEYACVWRCAHLIQGERLLLQRDAMLLHSALVTIHGKAVLFAGPSGAGKSTQAQLWQTHLGAQIINGDRTVVMKKADGFYGGGSIWSGTSHIYRPEQAPIAGIFLVTQAPDNRVERLGIQAFSPLYSQTTVNSWDPDFIEKITDLYSALLTQVPVYRLYCRPDHEAVGVAYHELFGKECL